MTNVMTLMTDASRGISLRDLGYTDVGLDDCWQSCGSYGPNNYTYHLADGTPVVNTTRFPSLAAMTAHAHALNLTAGFYGNNCHCKDHVTDVASFAAEVNFVVAAGFDSVKLDGCGAQENIELWYDLYNWTQTKAGKAPILIENCHNGPRTGSPAAASPFGPFVPTRDWCPFHMYRSSTDIAPVFGSILSNLETIPPLAAANLSTPGCWAYPDMLEVGIMNTQKLGVPPLNFTESRAHFGAWCITSSPLIIGFDLTNATTVDFVWPIVSNTEAIAIQSDYAGFSGSRFFASDDVTFFTPCGWWAANCTFPSRQYWYKPLSNGDVAVLLMNNGDAPADLALEFHAVPGFVIPQGSLARVRDVWNRADLGEMDGAFVARAVPSRDSVFLRLTPVAA